MRKSVRRSRLARSRAPSSVKGVGMIVWTPPKRPAGLVGYSIAAPRWWASPGAARWAQAALVSLGAVSSRAGPTLKGSRLGYASARCRGPSLLQRHERHVQPVALPPGEALARALAAVEPVGP